MGKRTISYHGNDTDGQGKRTTFPTTTPTFRPILTIFYSRKEQRSQQGGFLQPKMQTRRITNATIDWEEKNKKQSISLTRINRFHSLKRTIQSKNNYRKTENHS